MSDPTAVDRLFDGIDALDVLINNADIAGPRGQIDVLEVEDIRRTLDVAVMGQFLTTRRAAPLLRASASGAIITISSVAGRLGYAMRTPYAAAQGVTFEAMEAEYLSNISLRRMVGPEDVASLALFLCSAAGGNISDQAISVCGNVETL